MRVLVCGGRDFNRADVMERVLNTIHEKEPIRVVISGMAKGADKMGWEWGKLRGIEVWEFPADWETHGKAAGPIRNQQMLDGGHPDLVVAFPTKRSRGTWDMVRRAEKAGVKVIVVREDEVQEE